MRELTVVGIALSPEYVIQIQAGSMVPDNKRFGVVWINESELAAAFDMEGAFNDVALQLMPGANEPEDPQKIRSILHWQFLLPHLSAGSLLQNN